MCCILAVGRGGTSHKLNSHKLNSHELNDLNATGQRTIAHLLSRGGSQSCVYFRHAIPQLALVAWYD